MTLLEEVRLFMQSMKNRGEVIPALWLTTAIVKNHPGIEGDDSDWYNLRAHEAVRAAVRKAFQDDKLKPQDTPEQQKLPGFRRLQKYYLVERDDEVLSVPINTLTEDEQSSKISELERMGKGCYLHAEELRRYFERKAEVG